MCVFNVLLFCCFVLSFSSGAGGERSVQQLLFTAILGTARDSVPEGTGPTSEGGLSGSRHARAVQKRPVLV